ncbi:thioredoxin [Mariniphaga anaerophila]|uniref:Thioredoxin n=1 Tax=Mariniphaga anaerophila TaxID=1484053 RepID=A0A1M4WC25_9BACT|nr:thioredoxin [Mariniphaga anaerophila]SHE78522.1 thioredoxin [Mariniphaga anaerophila]
MSATLIVIIAILVVLIGLITFNYYRMKNMKPVPDSDRIKVLGNKNFKPVISKGITLVDFWAPWCGPCKMVAPILNELAESDTRVTVGKVNVDQQQQLAQKFKVRNIPTLVMFRDGKEVRRYVGVKTKKFLEKEITAELA